MTTLNEGTKQMKAEVGVVKEQLKRSEMLSAVERDRMEQYSRKENLITRGIKEAREETEGSLCNAVQKIAEITGTQLGDPTISISAIHRLGKVQTAGAGRENHTHARPVIVRLTSRRVRQQILRGKKNLKNNTAIRDDDTFLEAFHLGLQQGSTVAFSGHPKNKELLK